MSLQYLTHKKKKEKFVEDLLLLHCEHRPTQPQKKTLTKMVLMSL
jgi:hypothetical protein